MLTNLGKEDQVKHIHLIHYEITGVPPNNIDYLKANLMRDFEVLMRLYDDKKGVVSVRQVFYHLLKKDWRAMLQGRVWDKERGRSKRF